MATVTLKLNYVGWIVDPILVDDFILEYGNSVSVTLKLNYISWTPSVVLAASIPQEVITTADCSIVAPLDGLLQGEIITTAQASQYKALTTSIQASITTNSNLSPISSLSVPITSEISIAISNLSLIHSLSCILQAQTNFTAGLGKIVFLSSAINGQNLIAAGLGKYIFVFSNLLPVVSMSSNISRFTSLQNNIAIQTNITSTLFSYRVFSVIAQSIVQASCNEILTATIEYLSITIGGRVGVSGGLSRNVGLSTSILPEISTSSNLHKYALVFSLSSWQTNVVCNELATDTTLELLSTIINGQIITTGSLSNYSALICSMLPETTTSGLLHSYRVLNVVSNWEISTSCNTLTITALKYLATILEGQIITIAAISNIAGFAALAEMQAIVNSELERIMAFSNAFEITIAIDANLERTLSLSTSLTPETTITSLLSLYRLYLSSILQGQIETTSNTLELATILLLYADTITMETELALRRLVAAYPFGYVASYDAATKTFSFTAASVNTSFTSS